jgi:protein TonB
MDATMNAIEEIKEERKNQVVSYSVTFVVHALLFMWLWFSILHTPDPPLGFGGTELAISLGEPDMGGPSEIPVEQPANVQPTPEPPVQEEQIVTAESDEDNNVIAKPPVEQKKPQVTKPVVAPKPVVTPPVEKPRVADPNSLFKKPTTKQGDAGRGDGPVPGNQGDPNGSPDGSPDGNSDHGNGNGGTGGGPGGDGSGGPNKGSFVLRGRNLVYRPDIVTNIKEPGKVVVAIVVNREGKVIKAVPGQKGSTTLNPASLEEAKQSALKWKFSPNPQAPEEQFGSLIIHFKY